jgi:cell wall-associated NlpC family hydrolase
MLDEAHKQGADTPEDLQRAQQENSTALNYNTNIAPDPTQFKKLYQVEPQSNQQGQVLDPTQAQQVLFDAQQSNKPNTSSSGTYDFDSAIRARLNGANSIGDQANTNIQNKALAAQQAQYQGLQGQYANGQQQGIQNGVAGSYASNGTFVPSRNPRSAQEAIAWAKQAAANGDSGWYRQCLAFVARAYGLPSSGTNYAIDAFNRLPAGQKFTDRNPQPGALMFWKGSSAPGHVAIYVGNGQIASTDIGGAGRISIVPMNAPETKWGQKYVGWSLPNFATSPR